MAYTLEDAAQEAFPGQNVHNSSKNRQGIKTKNKKTSGGTEPGLKKPLSSSGETEPRFKKEKIPK
jgi:hypothetical protein